MEEAVYGCGQVVHVLIMPNSFLDRFTARSNTSGYFGEYSLCQHLQNGTVKQELATQEPFASREQDNISGHQLRLIFTPPIVFFLYELPRLTLFTMA